MVRIARRSVSIAVQDVQIQNGIPCVWISAQTFGLGRILTTMGKRLAEDLRTVKKYPLAQLNIVQADISQSERKRQTGYKVHNFTQSIFKAVFHVSNGRI